MSGKLFLVATPIGNPDDITLRALNTLKSVDLIACEELKPARRLLSEYGIEKELIPLNEHNEQEAAKEVVKQIKSGKNIALISDGGTPLFSDPGHFLLQLCIQAEIQTVPVVGANSLIPALTASGLDTEKFYYYGWLSPKKEVRKKELQMLTNIKEVIVLLDTPYRLIRILNDVKISFGKKQKIVLAYKITMDEEQFFRGDVSKVLAVVEKSNLKGEFVLLIDNKNSGMRN